MDQLHLLKAKIPHQLIYVFFLIVVVFGLSMGNIFMSIGTIGLVGNWLVEMDFKNKWNRAKEFHYSPLIATLLFIVPLIWMFNTEDVAFGTKDLIIKLPLLSLPIVIGTMPKLSYRHWWVVMGAFLMGLIVSTTIGYLRYVDSLSEHLEFDGRNMAVFISHIRLSLLIGLGIFILLYLLYKLKTSKKYLLILPLLYFVFFIRLMESGTGYIVLLFIGFMSLFFFLKKIANQKTKMVLIVGAFSSVLFIFVYVFTLYKNLTEIRDVNDLNRLETHTPYGNPYEHDIKRKWLENGNYIWIYISFPEVEKAWNERSDLPFEGKDKKGQPIFGTLFRFLTSKGLRKDYDGVYALTENEIAKIENGITTYLPPKTGFTARIENVLFELVNHQLDHNPNGHSIIQRLLYTQAGWELFKSNWIVGVGTGDGPITFEKYYHQIDSPLYPENRLRSHNQFLTFMICFGIIGFSIIIFSMIYPVYKIENKSKFFWVFSGLAVISFLVDDTLDTQAGVTFYAFFYSFFLFQTNHKIIE
jgi:O-antigen ligase